MKYNNQYMLQDIIKADLRKAMLEKDTVKRDLLRVIVSEIERIFKLPTTKLFVKDVVDEEVVVLLKKGIENAKLCHTEFEIPIYELYMPKAMTDQEMWDILIPVFNPISKTNIGELMKAAKDALGSNFDGKRVNNVIKQL